MSLYTLNFAILSSLMLLFEGHVACRNVTLKGPQNSIANFAAQEVITIIQIFDILPL